MKHKGEPKAIKPPTSVEPSTQTGLVRETTKTTRIKTKISLLLPGRAEHGTLCSPTLCFYSMDMNTTYLIQPYTVTNVLLNRATAPSISSAPIEVDIRPPQINPYSNVLVQQKTYKCRKDRTHTPHLSAPMSTHTYHRSFSKVHMDFRQNFRRNSITTICTSRN